MLHLLTRRSGYTCLFATASLGSQRYRPFESGEGCVTCSSLSQIKFDVAELKAVPSRIFVRILKEPNAYVRIVQAEI